MVRAQRALPGTVRALSWVSFANDLASELVYPVLPLFLTITLGAPVAIVGVIEGIAEGVAVGLRALSGVLSDRAGGRRRPWIVAGYGISALARPVVAIAPAWGFVLGGRLADRLGKATRSAPRDALIKDASPLESIGASFGYHRALDTAGAVLGPLLAVVLIASGTSLRTVLWIAVVPGFVALLLFRRVTEAKRTAIESTDPLQIDRAARLPRPFWIVLAIWTVFSLGNSSDVFLILRAHDLGLGATLTILAYALYNIVYSALSWPLGALSDRRSRPLILGSGLAVFVLVYLGFAYAPSGWATWPLFTIYGVYIAATEGVARAWVSDHAGDAVGTAYGFFAAATGGALLVASVVAGLLWSHVSPRAPFLVGAGTASLAVVLLLLSRPLIATQAQLGGGGRR